jgi:hypothetical protein
LRSVALVTVVSFATTSCGSRTPTATGHQLGSAAPIGDQALIQQKDLPPGLDLRVSNGREGAPAYDRAKLAPATKLSDAAAEALLLRATPIASDPADPQAFALRSRSQPPPRTGQTIKGAFPPAPSTLLPPVASEAGKALRVLRWMPEGSVPLAPELSVTFSQPMVAVTSQEDAASVTPVKLTPTPKGRWRWIGTRTILFDPEVRFPQATTYAVEIPAGTKSAGGGALAAAVKFSFETPAPTMVDRYPGGSPQHVDVPMFVMFDQKIDPAAVLTRISVSANGKAWPIELMTAAQIAQTKDKQLKGLVDAAIKSEQQGRWLAFRGTQPFPSDAAIHVEIGEGTPSAEGPNKTTVGQSYVYRTYPPLKIDRTECGWGSDCRPGMPLQIIFNNPLDADRFADEQVSLSPAVPGLKIAHGGTVVSLIGLTKPRTTYKAVVSGGVTDEFGQTLGRDVTVTFQVGDAEPTFF